MISEIYLMIFEVICVYFQSSDDIPNTLEEIGKHTFIECSRLIEIKYEGTKEQFNKIKITKDYQDVFSWPSFEEGNQIICTDGILTLE